jgi:hypothetical protein
MFSVQFATLGLVSSACAADNGSTHQLPAADTHSKGAAGPAVIDHAAMTSTDAARHRQAGAAHGKKASHECVPEQGPTEPASRPMHCEFAAPCGSLLFTTIDNAEQIMVVVERYDTTMPDRFPAAILPAPDAPPPRD